MRLSNSRLDLGRAGRPALLAVLLASVVFAACGDQPPGSDRWVGKTFALDIPDTHWAEPKGIGGEIGAFVPQFLLAIDRGSGGSLKVTVATGTAGVQDPCNPTTEVSMTGASYPSAEILANAFPMRLVDTDAGIVVNTTVRDLTFSNVLPGDAPAEEGQLGSTVNVAELWPLFTKVPNRSKETVCAALASFGAPCAACAFDGQPYCLSIKATYIGAMEGATSITTVQPTDIPASCSPQAQQ